MNPRQIIGRLLSRRALLAVGAALAVWTVAGFLVLPYFLRPVVERKIAERLHRPATLRRFSLNPFALSVTLEGLDVKNRGGASPFFSVERLYANLEAASIFRGGPVIRALTLTKPSLTIVRNEDRTYSVQDLLDEASKPKPAPRPEKAETPLRFSVNNIRVEGGSVDFDDRPERTKHTVRDLKIGIPFLSNIPSKVEITTQPVFEAKVNGTPFSLHGTSKPFSETRETTVEIDLSGMDLSHYFAYAPPSTPWKLASGRLDAKIRVVFTQPPRGSPALVLSGTVALRDFAAKNGDRPLLAWDRFETVVDSFDVFKRRARIRSLKAVGLEAWVRREAMGEHRLAAAFIAPATGPTKEAGAGAAKGPAAASPFTVEVEDVRIERGRIHYDDTAFARPFHALLEDVAASVKGFSTSPGKVASLEVLAKSDAGETLKNTSTVSMEPFVLEGTVEVAGLVLKRYAPFYERLVTFDVDDGTLDLATKYRFSTGADANTTLSALSATLRSPRLRRRDAKEPFFKAKFVKMTGTSLDLGKHDIALGEISSDGGLLAVVRGKDGNADLAELMARLPPDARPEPPSAPWSVALGRLALDGYTVHIEDHATGRPARYALTKTGLSLENFSTARDAKGALSVRFGVNGRGTASAKGPVGIHPTYAELDAEVKSLDLVPLEPYVLSNFKLSLASATLSARGVLSLREGAEGKASAGFAGRAAVQNLLALDEFTKLDFFKWDAFSLQGMKAGYNPTFLQVAKLAITGLACDSVIEADGTVNLRRVVGKPAPPEGEEEEPAEPTAAAGAPPPAAAPAPPAPETSEKVPIRIDTLTLEGGRIGLADHFIKPNYAATLMDLRGSVAGLSTEEGTVAQLDLSGRLASNSPLRIAGRVNPLAATAFADVTASFRGIDLPPFTPYSGKYAGYAIARGTLTMELKYKLENRKLTAENRLLVDQLEFGEKVESKDATKLPVRLAVSLLRDKDGLIDLDLPIEGSLDDPKFRLGKVIWQVIGNLIGKAATAPFALLGKVLGGGKGEEFSSVDFAAGHDALDDTARKKLDALAKALNDRPALKLKATGRLSGEEDLEGLRRLRLERKVKAQKLADLVERGEAPASVDAVVIDSREYATYLKEAYKKEKFKKPGNFLGIAKDIPAPEMESLMLANLTPTTDDLRQLALARANAVKDYLTGPGRVEAARVFILEPGGKPAAPEGKASASRVDFALE
jgi:outer membrane protein OmpA-like peptidoglycan-associated protein